MGPVVLALISALAYGVSDFFGGLGARRVPVLRILVAAYPISAVIMTVVALIVGGSSSSAGLAWGMFGGIALAAAAWTFYAALGSGPISIVSPLTALVSAAIPLVVGLGLGERPDLSSLIGVLIALVAVVLVSMSPHADTKATHPFTVHVAMLTLAAGALFALSVIFTAQIPADSGLWPLVAARWAATASIVAVALPLRSLTPPRGAALGYAGGVGVLDCVAHIAMMIALQQGLLSIGSVVIALFPAVTVVLAVVLLRERLTLVQVVGLALGVAAIVLISL
ncbi:MAG: DMT family transporter [Mobilicoccus sp.]|nr:DMT family transporter [Mobilicoccus sp.]